MSFENPTLVAPASATPARRDIAFHYVQWTPIVLGALAATALSSILIAFAATIGLSVTSTSPTWRDASAALWILSGLYLVLQAMVSFGLGGYVAGRIRTPVADAAPEQVNVSDGVHGLGAWALAVVMGVVLAALVASASVSRVPSATTSTLQTSTAEPLLSYEIDRLLRPAKRAPSVDQSAERAQAGRILLTSSSHEGVSTDDRAYLIQEVTAITGLAPADAERRVDNAISDSSTAISRSRRSSVILAFFAASALLLGAVAAWSAACTGGSHRDGAPLPEWMERSNRLHRRPALLP
jgi:hypothetical protein